MADNIDSNTEQILERHFPLHFACYRGDEARVQQLLYGHGLQNGTIDIYEEDGLNGWTPMHWAALSGKWKCLELISRNIRVDLDVTNTRFNQTLAHIAVQRNQLEFIAQLVQHGISLGIQDYMGDTPLHKAAQSGHLQCVRLLMSHCPILSTFNHSGQTPLEVALRNGHTECAKALEEASASQHSSFFPTSSSPILMNGEGIYQNGVFSRRQRESDQDMEMEEEVNNDGDAVGNLQPQPGLKRSCQDGEEAPFKRPRLFAPSMTDKLGTVTNNNILSSYQGVLAMSVEPSKPPAVNHISHEQQVHAMPTQPFRPSLPAGTPADLPMSPFSSSSSSSSSVQDHCNAIRAQHGYESMVFQSLISSDYGS